MIPVLKEVIPNRRRPDQLCVASVIINMLITTVTNAKQKS